MTLQLGFKPPSHPRGIWVAYVRVGGVDMSEKTEWVVGSRMIFYNILCYLNLP